MDLTDELVGYGIFVFVVVFAGFVLRYARRAGPSNLNDWTQFHFVESRSRMPLPNTDGTAMTVGGVDAHGKAPGQRF